MQDKRRILKIRECNVNSINARRQELTALLMEDKEAIYVFNDTRLCSRHQFEIRGFKSVRKDHRSDSSVAGGVAVFIPDCMSFVNIENDIDEMLSVEVRMTDMRGVRIRTTIVTRYLHPRERLEEGFLRDLTELSSAEFLVFMGDLNGRMGLVPGEGTNAIGTSLLNQIEEMGFLVLNNDQPTYISSSNSSQASLDVCLIRTRQRDKLSCRILDSVCKIYVLRRLA